MMSNIGFAQGAPVIHRASGLGIGAALQDEDMPARIGNIISPAWLAAQMGLPVEEVQERLAEAERRSNGQEVRPVRQTVA